MPRTDKSLRLQGLRDRLHLAGQHAPTFNQSVNILLETIGLVKSRRNLSYVRRDVQKLRDRTPDMTTERLEKVELLESRLARKLEMADNRKARRAEGRVKEFKQPTSSTSASPPPDQSVW